MYFTIYIYIYLITFLDEDIVTQLNQSIKKLGEGFATKIVVNTQASKNKKDNQYSDLMGEIDGETEATEGIFVFFILKYILHYLLYYCNFIQLYLLYFIVLRIIGQQLRSTLEDQADSFVSVLEDMSK